MQRPLGYWLKLLDRLIDESFESTLDEHGVTRREWQLMNLIARAPATREALDAEVSPFLSADETTASSLDELVESDWLDARDGFYSLTEKGESAMERLGAVVAQMRADLSTGVSAEHYDITVDSLKRMAQNLGHTDTDSNTDTNAPD